jgi:dihydrofolate synthase/folylpolyglutamate synthase
MGKRLSRFLMQTLSSQGFPHPDQLLAKYERFGIHLGLERMQQLLAALGGPHAKIPILHVAGSNGKGSVCAYLSAILTAAGYRVGRFTSPHLVSWTERICINEQQISLVDLSQVIQQVEAVIDCHQPSPTQFEVITAAAWCYFAAQQIDIAVIEVGLGGRLDATNVCAPPLVSIITSLSREHWQRLGPTLADIAGEKAGILKPGRPAVIAPLPVEAEAVIKRQLTMLGCPAYWPEPAQPCSPPTADDKGTWARLKDPQLNDLVFPLPLPGQFQWMNAALAITSIQLLRQQGWQISDTAMVEGMKQTRWPGRLQWFSWQGQKMLIDGAHNPGAAHVLRQYIDALPQKPELIWVMGMLTTKDHSEVLQALLRPGDALHLVPVPGHSSAEPQELATLVQQLCPQLACLNTYTDWQAGLAAAHQQSERLTILCGSLYLIGCFFANLQNASGKDA